MYFKIEPGCGLYDQLIEFNKRMMVAQAMGKEVADSIGATDACMSTSKLVGGISAFKFEKKPEGFRRVGKLHEQLFYPREKVPGNPELTESNQKLLKRIEELPTIEESELNSLLGFEGGQVVPAAGGGLHWVGHPSVFWRNNCVLVVLNDACQYSPVPGMTEIVGSEFKRLREETELQEFS